MDQSANLRTSTMYLSGNQPKGKENRRARNREKEREEKARIRVLPLIFFFADNDTVHSTSLFEWYSLSIPLSFSLNYDGGLHWVLQITD
jgi:hypothetical protein